MTGSGSRISLWWSRRARLDVRRIGDFIACDKPEAAARWVERITEAVGRLTLFPGSGRTVPEVGRDDVREIVLDGYRIIYQIRENMVIILTVFEGHMRLPKHTVNGEPSR